MKPGNPLKGSGFGVGGLHWACSPQSIEGCAHQQAEPQDQSVGGSAWLGAASEPGHLLTLGVPWRISPPLPLRGGRLWAGVSRVPRNACTGMLSYPEDSGPTRRM